MVTKAIREAEKKAREMLAKGETPPRMISSAATRGRSVINPVFKFYQRFKKEKEARKKAVEAQQRGDLKLRHVSLGRSAADAINDPHIGRPGDGAAAYQYDVAYLNQRVLSGQVKPSQYKSELSKIDSRYRSFRKGQSKQFAWEASARAPGQRAAFDKQLAKTVADPKTSQKQIEAGKRGTDTRTEKQTASDVKQSLEKKGVDTTKLTQAKKGQTEGTGLPKDVIGEKATPNVVTGFREKEVTNTSQVLVPTEKVTVTTPDGKERTFKDQKTAERFVKRTEGSYIAPISVPSNILGFISPTQFLLKDDTRRQSKVTTVPRQDYPRNYGLSDITPQNIARGFYEGGVLPLAQTIFAPKPIFTDIFGRSESEAKALKKTTKKVEKTFPAGPTTTGSIIEDVTTGQPIRGTGEGLGYDVGSFGFDIATALAPAKKVPIPLRIQSVRLPTSTGPKVVARTMTIGVGTKSKPVISVVQGKVQLGTSRFTKKVEAVPFTPEQTKRGIKLAADSSQVEQRVLTNIENLKQIKGVSATAIKKAENIKQIIAIGSKSKDPVKQSFPTKPFKDISETETPSVLGTFESQQSKLLGKLGPLEGSLSQQPFIMPKFLRQAGDFDFNLKNFPTAAKRARQTAREIKPDTGRVFEPRISEKSKSAKIYLTESGKSRKVGEFLNPEEKDLSGAEQVIKGTTLFGEKIPKGTKTVDGLKVFELQRQFLKKGESIFSLQKKGSVFDLGPAEFRKKDIADFYAIGKTKAENLRLAGRIKEADLLESELVKFKKLYSDVDIDSFFKKGVEPDSVTLNYQKSLVQRIGSSTAVRKAPSSGAASLGSSSRMSPSRPAPSRPQSMTSPRIKITQSRPTLVLKNNSGSAGLKTKRTSPVSRSGMDKSRIGKTLGSRGGSLGSLGSRGGSLGSGRGASRLSLRIGTTRQPVTTMQKKRLVGPPIKLKGDKSFGKPKPKKNRFDFRGNVREDSIFGIYGREKETTYNPKKILALSRRDRSLTRASKLI